MKKILITGINSYVGNSLEMWLARHPEKYKVEKISLRDNAWKNHDFSRYDVVVHVAGIAHVKETKKNKHLYYKVNRDLAFEVAQKAKRENISQFIFLSSMSVYGINEGIIDENTITNPKSNYGRSKLEAEKLIRSLEDEKFKVAILRPPMIYGKGCKGNYQRLAKLAHKLPFFPDIKNKRSMIYIDNLNEFVRISIEYTIAGTLFPQNSEFICSLKMYKKIREVNGKNTYTIKFLNPLLKFIGLKLYKKVFSDLVYDKKLSNFEWQYNLYSFEDSIKNTEVN